MWKGCRALSDQGRYCIHLRFHLGGPLREEALRRALEALVRRHEILRTTFSESGGAPVQTIHPPEAPPFSVRDLRGLSEEAIAREARAAERGAMDLERGPLFFATLLRLGETGHLLILTLHHLLGDFQAARLLYRDLGALYAASSAEAAGLPPARQAADLAWAERERWTAGGDLYARSLAAWLATWSEPPPPASPPALLRWRRFAGAPLDQSVCSGPIAASSIAALETLARQEEATLYIVLFAAFAFALLQHSGRPELLLGTYVSTRGAESGDALGLFVQLLPLRLDLRGAGTFRGLLRRVRESVRASAAQPDAPLEDFALALRARGQAPPAPELLFQFLHSPAGLLQLEGLETERWTPKGPPADMPSGLVLTVRELGGRFQANLVFDATRYRPARVAALHRTFLELPAILGASGDCPLPATPGLWRRLQLRFTSK
jgi:hypothetical protein